MSINNLQPSGNRDVPGWRNRYRYAVFEHKLVFDGTAYTRSFIVLKNQYDVIVHFTCFHNYTGTYEGSVYSPLASDAKSKMNYVCAMLNYILIDNYETFGAGHVFGIDKNMLAEFFQDYALEKLSNGRYRSRQSIEKCVSFVTGFFRNLHKSFGGYMAVSSDELHNEKTIYTRRGKMKKTRSPNFKVRGVASERRIFRDMPTKAFQIVVSQAFQHTPEIAFAICLGAFAGLRPGEVCNVRQEGSPLGGGLTVTYIEDTVRMAELDLRTECVLRGDGVRVGGIKKKRRQRIYPAFLPAFQKAYEFHLNLLSRCNYEKDYCPMFVGRTGKAITYFDFRHKFQHLVSTYVRPVLLDHEDPECRLYGQLLCENALGPHSLRHWFSVQLVLMGEDIAGLQYWRGDSSPESALVYLQNKGDLIKELSAANELLADFFISEGDQLYGV